MKKVIHKSMAVFMALVVLVTTMSFTIDMHYCGDTLVDTAIFHKAKGCGMEKAAVTLSCENPIITQKSCCSNEQLVIQGQDDLRTPADALSSSQQIFVTSFIYSYISLFGEMAPKDIPFVDYPPPFVKRDVQALHQVFLI